MTTQVLDQPRAASVPTTLARAHNANGRTVELELDLGMGQKARLFPDLCGYGHLTFGCDAHNSYSDL